MQLEELLQEYKNVCILRVRMPITSDLTNPRNFITKISRYNKVGARNERTWLAQWVGWD